MSAATCTTKTTCPYCGVGCGVNVTAAKSAEADYLIAGDKTHPANLGRLCSKGAALGQTLNGKLNDSKRLLYPEIQGERMGWDHATSLIADRFKNTIEQHGRDAVALYVSGQILTEDYYVANKWMKGYIGSANIDTNSRLCMASSVAGHKRAFGADTVPGCYQDIEQAELVVLVGSNLAWCHPVLFQRLQAAKKQNPKLRVVAIDPRRTVTADSSDLHLPLASDTDVILFNGLLNHLSGSNRINDSWVHRHTRNAEECLESVSFINTHDVAKETGIEEITIRQFYQWFGDTEKVVTIYSQGVNQSTCGTDKVNAIINCHLATGRIGKPGCGPFSVTGQPNAMGGREVGGLANMLACHMDIDNPNHQQLVQEFWQSPTIATQAGLKAVDLFRAIDRGEVKAVWVMGTNPVDSVADAGLVKQALRKCDFVVVSDIVTDTDTLKYADVILPAAAWSEKDGTVTNSERCISRQRSFRTAPGQAMPDWWAICQVASKMGFADAFNYQSSRDIFVEYAALSGYQNNNSRDFDISAMAELTQSEYQTMSPFYWPQATANKAPAKSAQHQPDPVRFFAEGNFFHADGRARFIKSAVVSDNANAQTAAIKSSHSLLLNTGRIRDQWHTMTRTGYCSKLSSHLGEPFIEIHPADASRLMIDNATVVSLSADQASELRCDKVSVLKLRAVITDRVAQGTVFVPMHWTDQFASSARIDELIPGLTDPVSGQPGFKHTPVNVKHSELELYGFAILPLHLFVNHLVSSSAKDATHSIFDYWSLAYHERVVTIEFACDNASIGTAAVIQQLMRLGLPDTSSCSSMTDKNHLASRQLWTDQQQFSGLCFVNDKPVLADRSWLVDTVNNWVKHSAIETNRPRPGSTQLLAGLPPDNDQSAGAMICACNGVGRNTILRCIESGNDDVASIGKTTGAGAGCGSCQPELQMLINTLSPATISVN